VVWCLAPPQGGIKLEKKKPEEEAEDLARRKTKFRELVSVCQLESFEPEEGEGKAAESALFDQLHGTNPSRLGRLPL
jgi:hypothetical protein